MSVLRNLAAVMVRPRRTMRRILDAPRDRMIFPLVMLAALSAVAGDLSVAELRRIFTFADSRMQLAVVAAIAGTLVLAPIIFYVFGWIAFAIGRALEGTANVGAVRRALAWGLVPIVWALLYRIPAMFVKPATDLGKVGGAGRGAQISLDSDLFASGCGMALIFGLLDLATLIWWAATTSNALAEAEEVSALRGFGTLVLCMLAPIVVAVAAFLAT